LKLATERVSGVECRVAGARETTDHDHECDHDHEHDHEGDGTAGGR